MKRYPFCANTTSRMILLVNNMKESFCFFSTNFSALEAEAISSVPITVIEEVLDDINMTKQFGKAEVSPSIPNHLSFFRILEIKIRRTFDDPNIDERISDIKISIDLLNRGALGQDEAQRINPTFSYGEKSAFSDFLKIQVCLQYLSIQNLDRDMFFNPEYDNFIREIIPVSLARKLNCSDRRIAIRAA